MAETVEIVATGRDGGASATLRRVDAGVGRLGATAAGVRGAFSRMMSGLTSPFRMVSAGLSRILSLRNMLFAGAGGMLVKSVIDFADVIDDAALKTGMTRASLQALNLQATVNKASFDAVTRSLAVMARNALTASEGENEMSRSFKALGVQLTDGDGKLRSMDELLGDIAQGFFSIESATERAGLAQRIFGRGGKEILVMLRQGRAGIQAYREELNRRGMKMSDEQIKQLAELKDKLATLKLQGMSILAQVLGGGAAGEGSSAVEEIMGKLAELAQSGALDEMARNGAQAIATLHETASDFFQFVSANKEWLTTLGITAYGVKSLTSMAAAFNVLKAAGVVAVPSLAAVGTALGTITTALAVMAGAFTFTKWLTEATGLDEKLGSIMAKLAGWKTPGEGDAAEQVAAEEFYGKKQWAEKYGSLHGRNEAGLNYDEFMRERARRKAMPQAGAPSVWTGEDELSRMIRRAEEVRGSQIAMGEAEAAAAGAGGSMYAFQQMLIRRGAAASPGATRTDVTVAGAGGPGGAGITINGDIHVEANSFDEFVDSIPRPTGPEQS